MKALDDEIAKLSVDLGSTLCLSNSKYLSTAGIHFLEQSEKDLEETNRNLDALQQQVVNLDDHDADQVSRMFVL